MSGILYDLMSVDYQSIFSDDITLTTSCVCISSHIRIAAITIMEQACSSLMVIKLPTDHQITDPPGR